MRRYPDKFWQAVFILLLSTQLNAYADTEYFKEATADQPHATLKFESGKVGFLFPASIPRVIPLSINSMQINDTKQRWKIHAFGKFLIPPGDTIVFLSDAGRAGYPTSTFGYVKFHAQLGETYDVTHTEESEKVIFNVTNSKNELVTFIQVKERKYIYGGPERDKAEALYEAAAHDDTKKEQILLNDGVEPDWSGPRGNTALIVAALRGNINTVKILIKAGANVDATNSSGWTALNFAADRGHESIVAFLLKSGAHIDLRRPGEYSALMAAAEKGYIGVVKLLLQKGVYLKARHRNGKTALDFAREAGNQEIIDMLEEADRQ